MFKQLWCALSVGHRFVFLRNIYGDEINYSGGKRALWVCEYCEYVKATDQLEAAKECVLHKDQHEIFGKWVS